MVAVMEPEELLPPLGQMLTSSCENSLLRKTVDLTNEIARFLTFGCQSSQYVLLWADS